jgi:formylglycine-generating enzyme required for sulfatase activity/predicted Ser/Thr protein kinase
MREPEVATDIQGDPSTDAVASLHDALRELRSRPRSLWLDLARADQSGRWRSGDGVKVEEYLEQLPELREDTEETLVLICGEVYLRRENGESPSVDAYQRRFPALAKEIQLQFDVDSLLNNGDPRFPSDTSGDIPPPDNFALPGYEFLREIGRGGAGVVYEARQLSLDRHVAVKVLSMPASDPKRLTRQRQEAEILARLHHPNVVHVYEVLEHGGCMYLVMEFVEGTTLKELANGKPLPASKAARLVLILAETMQAVHEAGVLHRDLKPSNVLVPRAEQIKITDFGLAKLRSGDNYLTTEDSVLGTPSYMSPEQALGAGHSTGPEIDVYSLGAILYELLTGRPPHLGATVLETLALIREQDPVPPRQLQPPTPRDLETICLKCLAKMPTQRYATAGELAADLCRFIEGLPILARPPGIFEQCARFLKRKPATTAAAVCLAMLVVVVASAWWITIKQHQRLSAAALVQSIATADVSALPQLLGRLAAKQQITLPIVHAELQRAAFNDPKWVNLSIAELSADAAPSGTALLTYLPQARPAELPAIVRVLQPRLDALRQDVWQSLNDDTKSGDARLRMACLAAVEPVDDSKWRPVSPVIARALVQQNPLDLGTYTELLRPTREPLIRSLMSMLRNGELELGERLNAVGTLARFGDDHPEILVELIADADADEFRMLLPPLISNRVAAVPALKTVAAAGVQYEEFASDALLATKHDVDRTFDRSQRHRATAAVALWQLGDINAALQALGDDTEPALRAWTIELLAPLGVSMESIWNQAREARTATLRQALVLAMGQANIEPLSTTRRTELIAGLLAMYREDADAGVHSACRWLLENRLDAASDVVEADESIAQERVEDRNWYIGPNQHSFVVFRGPRKFNMGSPQFEPSREEDELLHQETIDHSFAISTVEVTIAQCRELRDRYFNHRYSPTDDCPANNISWYDAAAYCRRLSEEAGLPDEQMCYPPVSRIGPGMRLPDNWLERTGYRLPTEVEWEYACRGGVAASRSCGEGEEMPPRYAWYLKNSDNHAWPVGRLKPNNYGLFDMLGNVAERCHDRMKLYSLHGASSFAAAATDSELTIGAEDKRAFRGGNFGDIDQNVRSARRAANSVDDQWALIGFRVARTL